jgi:hypothetical protein
MMPSMVFSSRCRVPLTLCVYVCCEHSTKRQGEKLGNMSDVEENVRALVGVERFVAGIVAIAFIHRVRGMSPRRHYHRGDWRSQDDLK